MFPFPPLILCFVQTSVLSEFGMTSIICVLKKITLKAFEDLVIILYMHYICGSLGKHSIYVVPWGKKTIEGIIIFKF